MVKNQKVLALLSGGLDSSAMVGVLLHNHNEVETISFDYGQRHSKELLAAKKVAEFFKVKNTVVDLSNLASILSRSSLTSDQAVPEGHYSQDNMKQTVVPNRNMIMLAIAGGYALSNGIENVAFAAHVGDHAIYPDCRESFINALDAALELCDYNRLNLLAPFACYDKTLIASCAATVGLPLDMTWSCYKGGENHCGRCGTCVERLEAIHNAGIVDDPTVYDDADYWRDVTENYAESKMSGAPDKSEGNLGGLL